MKDFKKLRIRLQNLVLGDNMKKIKEIKNKIENNIFYKIFKAILYIIVVLILIVIIVQKVTKNNLSVGGYRMFVIVSESMKGEYDIGDVLISKSVNSDEIKVGDNVTYLGKEGSFKDLIITHKVIDINERDGKTYYITKGLANEIEDPEIEYSQIYGKVIYKFFTLSILAKLLNNNVIYYIIFVIVAIIMSIEISSILIHPEDDEEGDEDTEE
jgi:signal peptidase